MKKRTLEKELVKWIEKTKEKQNKKNQNETKKKQTNKKKKQQQQVCCVGQSGSSFLKATFVLKVLHTEWDLDKYNFLIIGFHWWGCPKVDGEVYWSFDGTI